MSLNFPPPAIVVARLQTWQNKQTNNERTTQGESLIMSHHHYAKEERLINKTLFSSTTILPSEERRAEENEKPRGNHSSALNLLASFRFKALHEWKKSGKSFFALKLDKIGFLFCLRSRASSDDDLPSSPCNKKFVVYHKAKQIIRASVPYGSMKNYII